MTNIEGFRVVSLLFSKENSTQHSIFIKEHSVRNLEESKPAGRTLFTINIPPYATEESLREAFSVAGKIEAVYLQPNATLTKIDANVNNGFQVAYIVFDKRESLTKCLKLQNLKPLSSSDKPVVMGIRKWVNEYNSSIYNTEKLSEEVNVFIKNTDKEEEKRKANEKEQVDDEGWTVVTKKGRNPGLSRKESVENKLIQKSKIKSKKKELKNFYTFQIKEQKMKNIIALRKSFQESKEKVNMMKKLRNFKPL